MVVDNAESFKKKLIRFKGFVRYIKDPDYHGLIPFSQNGGMISRSRDGCDNEHLEMISDCIFHIKRCRHKMNLDQWKRIVVEIASYQIWFLSQCLLDRFYAKHVELVDFFQKWDKTQPVSKNRLRTLMKIASHEHPLYNTLITLYKSLKLLQLAKGTPLKNLDKWSDLDDSLAIYTKLRTMISHGIFNDGLTSKDKLHIIERDYDKITKNYEKLLESPYWKTLISAIVYPTPHPRNLQMHRQRMIELLRKATPVFVCKGICANMALKMSIQSGYYRV